MLFLFKKVIGSFVIYPALFVVLALLGLLLSFWKRRLGLAVSVFSLLLLLFFSTEPGKDLVLKPLENAYPYPDLSTLNCTYVVVLGGGIVPHSPAEGGKGAVRPQVAKRLYEAYKLWRLLRKPVVVSGGKFYPDAQPEAEVMKEFLVSLGVPPEEVLVEPESKTTYQNALFVKRLLGPERICLVTSAYHLPRSVLIFKSFGFKVEPVPCDYRVYREPYGWYSLLPIYGSDTFYGFREYPGILFFELRNLWRAREDSNLRPTD